MLNKFSRSYPDRQTYRSPHVRRIINRRGPAVINPSTPEPAADSPGQPEFPSYPDPAGGQPSIAADLPSPDQVTPPAPPVPSPGQPAGSSPVSAYPPSQAAAPPQPYDFITNPERPTRAKFSLPGGSSLAMRALYAAGGLLVLIIVISVFKSLLGGHSNFTSFISVGQDQQELIHVTTTVTQQQTSLSTTNQTFAATTQLAIGSAQSDLVQYLANNGKKVNSKVLALRISTATDTQLTNAIASGDYDQTFQDVMQNKLNVYVTDLQQAYRQTSGQHGRALLSNDYNQAQLLLKQLKTPAQ